MGSKGGSTTTTTQKLPPQFLQAYVNSLNMAAKAVSTPYQAYKGQLVAGLNDTQLQGISNVNAAQGMALPAIQKGMDLTNKAAQGITPELYNQFYSPYVKDVANNTMANLMESNAQQSSGLKGGAIQAGAFGGDRGGVAQAEMARQQNLAMGQTMGNIYNQGYGQAMQLAGQQAQNYGAMGQQMAGLGIGAQGSVLQGAQAQLAAGAQQQATEQAKLSAAYEQYMQRLAYPYQQAQFYANIAQGLGSSSGGSSSTTTPGPSWGSQILGGLGAIGSIFSLSDERMKEDAQPIGELFDGQTIYRYRLKGDPEGKTHIGLMAQEVEKRKPGAVAEFGGLKGVNYRDATEEAASAGGLVPSSGSRMAFAEGGIAFYPWGDSRGWVPEGAIDNNSSSRIPDPPKPYDPGTLGEEWYGLKPLTEDQLAGLGQLTYHLGIPTGGHVNQYRGGLVRSHKAAGGPLEGDTTYPTNDEVDAYVAKAAAARGIDPDVAVRLWHAEGKSGDVREAWRSKSVIDGERESSYSPFQLNMKGGVGEAMLRKTGIDPSKVENWQPSVDFALDWGKEHGWNDWMGAKAIGLKPREGLPSGDVVATADGAGLKGAQPYDPPEFVVKPERRGLDITRIFANEENPNIIEGIMGRRMSPEARNAVMAASFAMLAGRSPFMGVNIGEAGKVGMQTYYNALAQKADIAKTRAETGKLGVEGTVLDADMRRKIYNLYQMSKANYLISDTTGQPFMSFTDWAAKFGFPNLGIEDNGAGPSTDAGVTSRDMPPPPGVSTGEKPLTDGDNNAEGVPGEAKNKQQPLGSITILADPADGPSPSKPNTLPFWNERIAKLTEAQGAAVQGGDPEFIQSISNQIEQARAAVNDLRTSEDYKNMTAFQSQYARTKSGLEKLAKINSEYEGGRLADPKADIIGTLQSMGLGGMIPSAWANETANYDMIMKGALDLALRNAAQLGSLAHAPGALMETEGKITPTASLSPAARYDIIRRSLADLDYGHDLYATWDQGYNFAQHQADFIRMNPYEQYLEYATKKLPNPMLPPNVDQPGAEAAPVDEATQKMLDTKFPNAVNGQTAKKRDGTKVKKVNGIWVTLQ